MNLQLSKRQAVIVFGIIGFIIFIILLSLGLIPGFGKKEDPNTKYAGINLMIAGYDDDINIKPFIDAYQAYRPGSIVEYTKLSPENYENELLDMLAEGNAPDIIFIKNTWAYKHLNKLFPAPEEQLSVSSVNSIFPQVVSKDFVVENKVIALPVFIDTLAMFYNKDFLDKKGFASPPETWSELQEMIPKLRTISKFEEIKIPAVPLGGTSTSIPRAFETISTLMLQFKAEINSKEFSVYFDDEAKNAVDFYLQFSNPNSSYYAWNDKLKNAESLFSSGELPIIFDFFSTYDKLQDKATGINIAISAMPQIDSNNPINFGSYWGLAVSKQSQLPEWAWDFIKFTTTNEDLMATYADLNQSSPALRSLIKNDSTKSGIYSLMARQALTAQSWNMPDEKVTRALFDNMIQSIISGKESSSNGLDAIQNELEDLW